MKKNFFLNEVEDKSYLKRVLEALDASGMSKLVGGSYAESTRVVTQPYFKSIPYTNSTGITTEP